MTWSEDCEAIRQTISLYCQLLDDQRFDELADLFAVDAVLPWEERVLRGRAAIRRDMRLTQRPKGTTRHLPFGPVIDVRGDGAARTAKAWTDVVVTVHPPDGAPFIGWTGRYHDEFQREDERWVFARHHAVGIDDDFPPNLDPVPGRRSAP